MNLGAAVFNQLLFEAVQNFAVKNALFRALSLKYLIVILFSHSQDSLSHVDKWAF